MIPLSSSIIAAPDPGTAAIPVPDHQLGVTVLGGGSGGNAIVVHSPAGNLLVDAGFSFVELCRRLAVADIPVESLRAVLVTHEHSDHVGGLRATAAALKIPIYCNRLTAECLRGKVLGPEQKLHIFTSGAAFQVSSFTVEPFSVPHDVADAAAFAFHFGGVKLGIATDLGYASFAAVHHLRGSDLLVVESNHDPRMVWASRRPPHVKRRILGRFGHLSNEDCMKLVQSVLHARTRHLVLTHVSRECNSSELVESAVRRCLDGLCRRDLPVHIASQGEPSPTFWAG